MYNGGQDNASEVTGLNIREIGLAAPCIIYIRAGVRTDIVRKMKKSSSSYIACLPKEKKNIISKLTVVVRDGLSTLIFIILAFFFFFFRISGYDAGSPECSKETRFDMIILQLGSPLCHMPDLSVGREMQLALLTINQPDGGGGGWWLWRRRRCCDGEVLAAAGCWPTFHYTHTHTHNQLLHVCKRLLQHSPVLLSHLLPRTSFVPFLLVSSHSHLARLYSSPFFFHLKASNIHHPSAQIHSAPRAAVRRAQQGESSEWTKYEDISSS